MAPCACSAGGGSIHCRAMHKTRPRKRRHLSPMPCERRSKRRVLVLGQSLGLTSARSLSWCRLPPYTCQWNQAFRSQSVPGWHQFFGNPCTLWPAAQGRSGYSPSLLLASPSGGTDQTGSTRLLSSGSRAPTLCPRRWDCRAGLHHPFKLATWPNMLCQMWRPFCRMLSS